MAVNPTHLEIHTGKTKKLRAQASAPSSTDYPDLGSGEIYVDNTAAREAIGIRNATGWLYLSLEV